MLMKLKNTTIAEAFENKKRTVGEIKFLTSTLNDPYIRKLIAHTAKSANVAESVVMAAVEAQIADLTDASGKAPMLYETMIKNAAETAAFTVFWDAHQPAPTDPAAMLKQAISGKPSFRVTTPTPIGPKFREFMFMKLAQSIRADHDDFFPLRGFVDRRILRNINWVFTPSSDHPTWNKINTAAATPSGTFIFNKTFMQCLLDHANIKQIKPAGQKYVSNGGDIPDEYAYIEFLIIHEFMHYSNDDFYYQKIIPNAKPTIINWVGDFRTNYLLVKSGYEQLPIGLFNDHINYDRQKEYIEMYNAVKAEMDKLPKSDQDDVSESMDGLSDDHEPGQAEGEEAVIEGSPTDKDIDANAKRIKNDIEKGKDAGKDDRNKEKGQDQNDQSAKGDPGGAGANGSTEIDYSKVRPTFNWRSLIKRFVATATPRSEETYAKPHRRSATGAGIMQQTGASAIKPGEKLSDHVDVNLAFCIDSSGSMSGAIASVYSNIAALLKNPVFSKSDFLIMRFSGSFDLHKGNFARNKAAKISNVAEKPRKYETTVQSVFTTHFGSGTAFSAECVGQLAAALNLGYNIMIFSDSDIVHAQNLAGLLALIKQAPQKVFVIFDCRETYIAARSAPGMITTPNMTHL